LVRQDAHGQSSGQCKAKREMNRCRPKQRHRLLPAFESHFAVSASHAYSVATHASIIGCNPAIAEDSTAWLKCYETQQNYDGPTRHAKEVEGKGAVRFGHSA